MIELHFAATPNGHKISIALEELELSYRLVTYDIFAGDQLAPALGAINPNHKLPAIVDMDPAFGGGPHAVFESAAILQYLADKTGRLLPADPRDRSVALQWVAWQAANVGPIGGQASHFMRYAPEAMPYAIERYAGELDRLLRVLERRLGQTEYVAGDEYSIADIALWPGRATSMLVDVDLATGFPNTRRWFDRIADRPAVRRGRSADKTMPAKYLQAKAELSADEWSNMFGQRNRAAGASP